MTDRLSPLDVSFLYMETPTTPFHVGGVAVVRAAGRGLRLRAARRPHHRADRARAALPAEGALHPRAPRQPGVGRRRGLRRHLPRAPQRAAEAGHRRPAARARRPADGAAARPQPAAVGDLPRRGARGRPGRRSSPRPTTRWSTASRRSTSAPSSSTSRPSRARCPPTTGGPHRAPGPVSLVVGAITDYVKRPTQALDTARSAVFDARATASKVGGVASGVLASAASIARPAPDSPLNVRIGEQRRFGMARDRPRRLQARPQGPRRDGQRRRARDRRRRAARLAAHPRRGGDAVERRPGDGAGVGALRTGGGRHRQPGLAGLRRPAGRRGQPGRAAAARELRDARPQGVGRVGRRAGARADVGLRAADDPLARRPGREQHDPAAVQPGGDQRAGTAVPAVRRGRADAVDAPGRAAREGPGAVDRADVVRRRCLLRPQRRPRRHGRRRRGGLAARGVVGRAGGHGARHGRCTGDAGTGGTGLVLGAGGVLGAAWTIGALAALREERGLDPRDASVLVGTSAGSVLASFLGCGVGVDVLLDHQRGIVNAEAPDISYDPDRDAGGALPPLPRPGIGSARGVRQHRAAAVAGHADGGAVVGAAAGPRLARAGRDARRRRLPARRLGRPPADLDRGDGLRQRPPRRLRPRRRPARRPARRRHEQLRHPRLVRPGPHRRPPLRRRRRLLADLARPRRAARARRGRRAVADDVVRLRRADDAGRAHGAALPPRRHQAASSASCARSPPPAPG